jgi:class 3 adenylate cyclase
MSKLIGKLSAAAIIAAGAIADTRGGRPGGRRPVAVPWPAVGDWLGGRRVSGLPSGVVTFLFTDIEGSTRLVKALRERYAEVLAEHRHLVRAAIADQAGYEVDSQGDAFFAAFASAKQAVLCAIQIQRALAGHQWPAGAPVRVRIGVHTGQAVPVEGAYIGLAVHRAARICAAARGGQVLVSQPTQMIIEDEEEEQGFTLVDLGERRLKDLDRPVHLFQLAAPGLDPRAPLAAEQPGAPGEATPSPEISAIPAGSSPSITEAMSAISRRSQAGSPPRPGGNVAAPSAQHADRGQPDICQTPRPSRTGTRRWPSRHCWPPSGIQHCAKRSSVIPATSSS